MSTETFIIGAGPFEEELSHPSSPDFFTLNHYECKEYIDLLVRKFGPPVGNSYFSTHISEQDFGPYREVAIVFDPEDPEAASYADLIENGTKKWDHIAQWHLEKYPHPVVE